MIIWTILFALYTSIGLFAAYMTCQEQKRQEHPSLFFNVLGYLVCAFWPLAVVLAFVAAQGARAHFVRAEIEE